MGKRSDAWTTFNTESMLGDSLLGLNKYAKAEPLLLQGFDGMKQRAKQIPPQGKVLLTEPADSLVQLYEAWEKPDEAAKWQAERAKLTPAPEKK